MKCPWILALALAGLGCAPSLRVTRVESAEQKPANVLLLFRVESGNEAVAGLEESAFSVKEDEHAVPPGEGLAIVNPDLRGAQFTIVMLDLGGRPARAELDAMSAVAQLLVERLGASRRIALYGLDGAEQPAVIAPIGAAPGAAKAAAARIGQWKSRDPSLNLHGGYLAALRAIRQLAPGKAEPKIANVVLITRGPDRAARATALQVTEEVTRTDADLRRFAVGFGAAAAGIALTPFADPPPLRAATPAALIDAATRIADAVEARGKGFYLLSYCTPSRAGEHRLKVDVARTAKLANGTVEQQRGQFVHRFRADGFTAGCTPLVPDGWARLPPAP